MTMLDSWAARVRASSINTWRASGECLAFVNWCFYEPGSRMGDLGPLRGGAENGKWNDAKQGWYGSAFKHPGDGTDAPAGVPIYWETGPSGNQAGHIALSDGDGWCYTTDYAGWPRSVSRERISRINALRGNALGWTDDFGNNPIDTRQVDDGAAQAAAAAAAALAAAAEKERIRKARINRRKNDMANLEWLNNGPNGSVKDAIYSTPEFGSIPVPSPQIYQLLFREINSDQTRNPFVTPGSYPEVFNVVEKSIMDNFKKLLIVQNQTNIAIDYTKMRSALEDALGKQLPGILDTAFDAASVTDKELAAAFEAAIPRISAATVKAAGRALAA